MSWSTVSKMEDRPERTFSSASCYRQVPERLWNLRTGQRQMPGSPCQPLSRSHSQLSDFLAEGSHGRGLFKRKMGPLQRQLRHGEYDLLRLAPMLESDFLQVSKRGEVIDVHNRVQVMRVAVACTSILNQTPDVLLLARAIFPSEEHLPPVKNLYRPYPPRRIFELTRLLPLRLVKISVHNQKKKLLRFKLASGRAFYLRLCSQPDYQHLFELWVKVVNLLRPPSGQSSATQVKSRDPGGLREAPAQRPQSPSPLNLADTVSIQTVYSFCKAPSPTQDDAPSRQSVNISLRSQHSAEDPHFFPIIIQEKDSEQDNSPASDDTGPEEPLEQPPSPKDLSSEEEVEYRSSPPPSRRTNKSRRRSRSKSSHRGDCKHGFSQPFLFGFKCYTV